jgi:hypothetical protein
VDESLSVEGSMLATGLVSDGALDMDLLGETVESDQLALSEDGGSGAAPVPAAPAPTRPRRRSQRPRPTP